MLKIALFENESVVILSVGSVEATYNTISWVETDGDDVTSDFILAANFNFSLKINLHWANGI